MPANIASTVRLVLTLLGSVLMGLGYINADQWGTVTAAVTGILGAAMPLVSLIWSMYENAHQAKVLTAAIVAPAQTIAPKV